MDGGTQQQPPSNAESCPEGLESGRPGHGVGHGCIPATVPLAPSRRLGPNHGAFCRSDERESQAVGNTRE